MLGLLLTLINVLSQAFSLLLIAYVVLSYFMDPYHPIRSTVNGMVEPILNPIRRIMPRTGMMDFSPLVAIILIQIIKYILTSLLIFLLFKD